MRKLVVGVPAVLVLLAARPVQAEQAREAPVADRLTALEERVEQLSSTDESLTASVQEAQGLEARLQQLEARLGELSQEAGAEGAIQQRVADQARRIEAVEAQAQALADARQQAEATPWVDYTAGDGLIIRPPGRDFQLSLRGFVWARYQGGVTTAAGTDTYTNAFSIPESRIRLTGALYGGRVQVVAEPSVVVAEPNFRFRPGLQDGYVELRLHPTAWFRAGQMLVPYDWETNTAPPCLPLVGLGSVPTYFGHARDLGLMLMGTLPGDKFHYRLGVFNGAGRGNPNDNHFLMVAALARYQILGTAAPGWGWSDLEQSRTPNLTLGVGFTYDYEATPTAEDPDVTFNQSVYQVTADLFLRWYGLSLAGVAHYRAADGGDPNGDYRHAYGYMFHVGYMAWARHLELLARYSEIDPNADPDVEDDVGREVTGGLTLFLIGHQVKLTALYAYRWHMPGMPAEGEAHLAQLQAQGWF